MIKLIASIFVSILFLNNINAQNLVPNPSFEECYDFPSQPSEFKLVKEWFFPYNKTNTPDYYHRKAKMPPKYSDFMGIPENATGYQETKDGDAFIGIFVWPGSEIIGCNLKKELENNKLYQVDFYVSLDKLWRHAIDNIGCYFSNNKIKYVNKYPKNKKYKEQKYNFTPQIVSKKGNPIIKNESWTKISGTYKAMGGEKYLYIGCFAPQSDITVKRLKRKRTTASKAYYYIDDVSVYELDSLGNPVMEAIQQDTLVNITDTLITQIENTEQGKSIVLRNIQFEFDKSELLPNSFETLNKLSKYLKSNLSVKIEISGHTDSIGSIHRNLELSFNRAKSVNDYLISKGIKQERINYKGYGSSQPIADNKKENGRELNRRVELKIIKK